jgi:holo-[acyl-carrier protein] synthase
MIISIGIDIVEIEEIRKSIENSKRFLERVFTPQEISYCEGKPNKNASYAARFAAKEAAMKALGTGWDKGVQWQQIEVVNVDRRRDKRDRVEVNSEWLTVNSKKSNRSMVIGNQKLQIANSQQLIANSQSGKPEIRLSGKALELSKEMEVNNIFLSLSHSKNCAVANVMFEGNDSTKTRNWKKLNC